MLLVYLQQRNSPRDCMRRCRSVHPRRRHRRLRVCHGRKSRSRKFRSSTCVTKAENSGLEFLIYAYDDKPTLPRPMSSINLRATTEIQTWCHSDPGDMEGNLAQRFTGSQSGATRPFGFGRRIQHEDVFTIRRSYTHPFRTQSLELENAPSRSDFNRRRKNVSV